MLNWNRPQYILPCLDSLSGMDGLPYRVIVVDNGSTDGSPTLIRERFPDVILIENGRNLGFAEGNNVGIRYALQSGSDYVLLLNDDTEVDPHFLRSLIEVAESDDAIGVVGPKICYYDEPQKIWSGGAIIDELGRSHELRHNENEMDDGRHDVVEEVDLVSGCAILVKASVIEEIGLLDPRFFAYFEETDWCARARKAGFKIVYVPQARIWHKIRPEVRGQSPQYVYLMTRNRLLFLSKSGASPITVWFVILAEYLRTILSWSLRPRHRENRHLRGVMLKGIYDFLRGEFGEPPVPVQ